MMQKKVETVGSQGADTMFADLLEKRRVSSDVMWMFRSLHPVFPHKLPSALRYSREQTIKAILDSPRIVLLIQALASDRKVPVSVVKNEAREMLEEMAGAPQLSAIRCLGILVTKGLKRILKSVRVNQTFLLDLKEKMRDDSVQYVYVPTHRSYLDFILWSYVLFSNDMAIPNIASGMDFYRMQVVGELLRKTGAFYMRRSFATDQLYKEVFKAYISSIVIHSERAIEFFIEGTRSRSQKSLAPKYGLLGMILDALWKAEVPDIKFVPVSITYDRPLEELLFAYELLGVPKPPESTTGLFKSLSVLQEPCAYGNAYINVAPPISARQFLDVDSLRKSALSPYSKPSTEVVTGLAYSIIDSQKRHTPLSPFNLIALLFNERVHSHPRKPYILETLLADYRWLKDIFTRAIKALVHPGGNKPGSDVNDDDVKIEVLDSLFTHRELLKFDSCGELMLMERHRESQASDPRKVKGHVLTEKTMRLAVPAINMATYVNPSMAFLAKPALVAVSIVKFGTSKESSFARYTILRELLCTEFAFVSEKPIAMAEWEEGLSFLIAEDCIRLENNSVVTGNNNKLFSLLRNLLLPFLAASYVTCTVLHQWNDEIGEAKECYILKNTQKQTELLLFEGQGIFRFPYSLSLDLYTSTLVSLVSMGIIKSSGRPPHTAYYPDKIRISALIAELDNLKLLSPPGSYLDIRMLPAARASSVPQSKL
ncbi:dihydroxyacetone phosphate acyltransferase [Neodiprion fabricii]|uniref:dihydroxyacetone phosphate acyltransferase n=1 Tax=Neodiprion fabricii TaxID=2872261 RepID=UPI001ED8F9F6|nr:dihydroxyacetone phosphate acyltransferase [Neodiprion fabricii]